MTEASYYNISKTGVLEQVTSLENALEFVKIGGYIWLDYYQPTKEQLSQLIEPLGMHLLSIEDCIDNSQIPKINDYPRNTFNLNNKITKVANDTNIIVQRLTFITTIFMPLPLLVGIGGISEWSMMTGPQNWRFAYPAFLLAMVVLGGLNYFLIKWIEKRRDRKGAG
jgi:Mg2+ and Co2+ transporter CorA